MFHELGSTEQIYPIDLVGEVPGLCSRCERRCSTLRQFPKNLLQRFEHQFCVNSGKPLGKSKCYFAARISCDGDPPCGAQVVLLLHRIEFPRAIQAGEQAFSISAGNRPAAPSAADSALPSGSLPLPPAAPRASPAYRPRRLAPRSCRETAAPGSPAACRVAALTSLLTCPFVSPMASASASWVGKMLCLELRLERYRALHRRDVLAIGVLDVHEHGGARIVGLDHAELESGVEELAGKSPAHAVDQLVIEVRIADQLARHHRLLLPVLGDRLDQILAAIARVPGGGAVVVRPRAATPRIHRKHVLPFERWRNAPGQRQFGRGQDRTTGGSLIRLRGSGSAARALRARYHSDSPHRRFDLPCPLLHVYTYAPYIPSYIQQVTYVSRRNRPALSGDTSLTQLPPPSTATHAADASSISAKTLSIISSTCRSGFSCS